MPLVLYPEDLQQLCELFDQVSARLAAAGVDYSPENLAIRLLESADELTLWPDSIGSIVGPTPQAVMLH
jgi:hypothetical protein